MTSPQRDVRVGVAVFILQSTPTTIPSDYNPTFIIGKRKGSHGAGTYALPGGHLEFGESPKETTRREVLEETGLKVKNVKFLTATNDVMKTEGKHYVTLFMVCEREDEDTEPETLEPHKCEGWEWARWEEFLEWIRIENEADKEGEMAERKLFLPLLNLVKQRPDVIPTLR